MLFGAERSLYRLVPFLKQKFMSTVKIFQENKMNWLRAQIKAYEESGLFDLDEIRKFQEPLRNQLRKLERIVETNNA